MITLPDVTLVMIETREHALALSAVEDCVSKVAFGDTLILTDKPHLYDDVWRFCKPRFHLVPDWPDKLGWCRAMWFTVPLLMRTSHMLAIQWDSWVWDTDQWTDEFLKYDYIGSPWWYTDGKNVGNSGFCLKSSTMARYIHDRRGRYPCDTSVEDDLLCRKYRPKLEEAGFVWAPVELAAKFAFECTRMDTTTRQFGFHGMFNWPEVTGHDRLMEKVRLAYASEYIRKSYIWKTFSERNPQIVTELMENLDGSNLGLSRQADA